MVPNDGIALWAWDARPFPAFPSRADVWADAENWRLGHWLGGRAGTALLPDVVASVCARTAAAIDVLKLTGVVSGYVLTEPMSARSALEPLMQTYGLDAIERDGTIVFRMRSADALQISSGRLVEEDGPTIAFTRESLEDHERSVRLRFSDSDRDYQPGLVRSAGDALAEALDIEAPLAMDRTQAIAVANGIASDLQLGREKAQFAMAADGVVFEPGDVVVLNGESWRIDTVTDGQEIAFGASRAGKPAGLHVVPAAPVAAPTVGAAIEPDVVIVDGPALPDEEDDLRPLGFVFSEPWTGRVTFRAGADADQLSDRGRVERPCAIGRLVTSLFPHVSGRWQETSVWVSIPGSVLSSASEAAVLNGANRMFVETSAGWELLQFLEAELVDIETYKLTRLLRGQQGSEDAMLAGAAAGARVAVLTGAEQRMAVAGWERGLGLTWRASEWEGDFTFDGQAARPWSPAHLKATRIGADLALSWIRRARKDGDSWGAGNPPIEGVEAYRVRISGGESIREWDVSLSAAVFTAAEQAADFPLGGEAVIAVAQIGPNGEPGAWTSVQVTIPAP